MSQQQDGTGALFSPDPPGPDAAALFAALGLGPADPLTEDEVGLLHALQEQGMQLTGMGLVQDAATGEVRILAGAPMTDYQAGPADETTRSEGIDAEALNGAGVKAYGAGQYPIASAYLRLALRLRLASLGAEHSDTLTTANNLASTLHVQGDLDGARRLQESVYAGRKRVLGAEHPDTLTSAGNLALTLKAQGELARIFHDQRVGSLVPRRVVIGISPPMPTEDCRCQSVRTTRSISGALVGG